MNMPETPILKQTTGSRITTKALCLRRVARASLPHATGPRAHGLVERTSRSDENPNGTEQGEKTDQRSQRRGSEVSSPSAGGKSVSRLAGRPAGAQPRRPGGSHGSALCPFCEYGAKGTYSPPAVLGTRRSCPCRSPGSAAGVPQCPPLGRREGLDPPGWGLCRGPRTGQRGRRGRVPTFRRPRVDRVAWDFAVFQRGLDSKTDERVGSARSEAGVSRTTTWPRDPRSRWAFRARKDSSGLFWGLAGRLGMPKSAQRRATGARGRVA